MSLLTLRRRRPLSGILRVTWRIISSKHCLNSSSLTGQMPLSRAWRSINFWSSISLKRATSILLAGYGLAFCIHYLPIYSWKVRRRGVKQIQIDRQLWKSVVALVLLTSLNPLSGRDDCIEDLIGLGLALHWGQGSWASWGYQTKQKSVTVHHT